MNPGFLSSSEIRMMQNDWERLLLSPEATIVTFAYMVGVGSEAVDAAFGVSDFDSEQEQSFTGRVIQEVVNKRSETLLDWGILREGDVIFYCSKSLDLVPSGAIEGSMEIVGPQSVRWTPVPRNLEAFHNYLLTRLGSSQMAQVIPCKLRK